MFKYDGLWISVELFCRFLAKMVIKLRCYIINKLFSFLLFDIQALC